MVVKANITIFVKWLGTFLWVAKIIGAIKESIHKLHFTLLKIFSIGVLYRFIRKWCYGLPVVVLIFKFIFGQLFRLYTVWLVGGKALDNRRFMSIGVTICIRLGSIKVVVYNFITVQAWFFIEAIHPKIHVVRNRRTACSGTTFLLDAKGKRRESWFFSVHINPYSDTFAGINGTGVAATISVIFHV